MSFGHYVTVRRPQLLAMVFVTIVACAPAAAILKTPPQYSESANVIFSLPPSQVSPNAYEIYASSLITSEEAMTQVLASPPAQHRMRSAGGTADVSMQLLNLYNQEYPEYPEPLATLVSASPSAADAHRTFAIAARLLRQVLASWQAQAGVPRRDRISAQIIADTGPVAQAGSRLRGLAGLALLTVIGAAWLCGLARRQAERRGLRRACSLPG